MTGGKTVNSFDALKYICLVIEVSWFHSSEKKTLTLIVWLWQKFCASLKVALSHFWLCAAYNSTIYSWSTPSVLSLVLTVQYGSDGSEPFSSCFFFSFRVPYWTCRMVSLYLNVLMQLMRDLASSWRIYWLCVTRQSSMNVPGDPSFYPYKRTRKTQPGNNNCTYIYDNWRKKVLSYFASCRTLENSPRVLWLCQVNRWSTLVTSLDD